MLDELVERSIHILRRPGRTLVTVVELLSPSNKVDPGRGRCYLKRAELMRRGVHLVEIDLLVAGHRLPLGGPFPPGDHFAVVSRGGEAHSEVYAWTLRQPLPTIPLPLSDPDPEIPFDLGAVFAYTYEKGRYARTLPYGEDVDLPLGEADRTWIRERAGAARG